MGRHTLHAFGISQANLPIASMFAKTGSSLPAKLNIFIPCFETTAHAQLATTTLPPFTEEPALILDTDDVKRAFTKVST